MFSSRVSSSVAVLKNTVFSRTVWKSIRVLPGATQFSCRFFGITPRHESASKNTLVQAVIHDNNLCVHWDDGDARFHHVWLRHHCSCPACINPKTRQRILDIAVIPEDVRPKQVEVTSDTLRITWEDGHDTCYHGSWLKENAYDGYSREEVKNGYGKIVHESERTFWNKEILAANPPPEFDYKELQENDDLVRESLYGLFRYGIIFVNETPTDTKSLAKVGRQIGGVVQETFFADPVYVLENKEMIHSDFSYLGYALDAHTDQTFFEAPPGIQLMHCTYHDGTGGVSLFIDGFMAAKTLFKEDPEAFQVLSTTHVPFEYNSDSLRIHDHGPLLELDPFTKELKYLRYNLSRVGPFINMDLTYEEMEKFYKAVRALGSILRRPENELWYKLTPGKVVVLDNRRVLHGRSSVTGYRKLLGCNVSIDDYLGRWRANKMNREEHE